jgi:hypothetical protein
MSQQSPSFSRALLGVASRPQLVLSTSLDKIRGLRLPLDRPDARAVRRRAKSIDPEHNVPEPIRPTECDVNGPRGRRGGSPGNRGGHNLAEYTVVLRRHLFERVRGDALQGAAPNALPESAVACDQADGLREAINIAALE